MFELPDDAIGIYHRMFDFFGVRIPFSSFLLTLIKHYRVHFSQLGPLGLNKVITFEVLCRSLQIKPTVTLFRVFQTLCKQADWFSFAKRRAPSSVCIDDNRSCMKHWKSGFFFIDCRAIPDAMLWIHPNADIDDLRPTTGSFNMADVRHLSAHVIKLRDMPEDVLVLSRLSRVWKSRVCDPVLWGADRNVVCIHDFLCLPEWTGAEVQEEPHLDVGPILQRIPFYCTPPATTEAVIPVLTLKDLAVGTPSFKIIAKVEASQKRKASTSGATSSHVTKRTSDDDDDDACVEIPLVTPLCFAAVIPSLDSQGKGVMVDDAVMPSFGVSRPTPSSRPAPSFKDVSSDAIHTDFFPFFAGPYYATYPEGGVARNCEFICGMLHIGLPSSEMVRVKSLSDDQLTVKMSVLYYMMMSHGVAVLKKHVSGLNDKLTSFDASFAKSKAKGKERKKKIKSLGKSLDNLHAEVARLSAALNQATILEAERDEKILQLKATPPEVQGELLSLAASAGFERGLSMHRIKDEFDAVLKKMVNFMPGAQDRLAEASPLLEPEKLVRSVEVPILRGTRVSPPIAKESTVTPVSESLELFANVNFTASAVSSKHNEEMINAEVDGSDPKMIDDTAAVKSGHAFVQGISIALDDVTELVEVGSGRVPSGPDDVVVALSAHEKGDGLDSSSAVGEEAAVNPSGV
ncbi:hypothetical protein Tco_0033881 [Tanacetum coccineum]